MDLQSTSRAYGNGTQPLSLTREAADVLAAGPLHSAQLIARVCRMPGVPAAVADDMAVALLGASTRFTRNADGAWSLAVLGDSAAARAPHITTTLAALQYLVVDVETTGHSPFYGDRITEIAAYSVVGNDIIPIIDTLINPRRPIPAFITSLTGISWAMVKHAPRFEEVCERIVAAMNGHVFVAHNVSFDWRFVTSEISIAAGMPPVAAAAPTRSRLCTAKLARALLPGLPRRSLDHVAFHLGVDIESRHRAGGDALATAKILRLLLKRAADSGLATWGDLESFLLSTRSNSRKARQRARRTGRQR